MAPPTEGIRVKATEGRYLASLVDGPTQRSLVFEVREGEETAVDLR